jgi:hypothetical protein
MSILAPARHPVKLHPSAPVNRPARPFGEGLTPASAPINRIAAFLPPAPAPVEQLSPADVAPTTPVSPEARLDAAWHSGYCLGADGIDAAPRKVWAADIQAAFLDGFTWGRQQRDADLEATAAMYAEMESADMPGHFAHCYA